MQHYKQGIKRRREERLRNLRKKERVSRPSEGHFPSVLLGSRRKNDAVEPTWSSFHQDYSSYYSEIEQRNKQTLKTILRIICSLMIVTSVYMVMSSENPQLKVTQDFIEEVMSRDFNVQGVLKWYEQRVGNEPAFLPKIIKIDKQETPPTDYIIPVSGGLVVSPFGQDQQGIKVKTVSKEMPIEVIKEGWVVFVGEKEGLGQTVIIDHLNGEESWYGHLQGVQVLLHDWVDQGEVIGYSTPMEEDKHRGIFYFALKKDATFIDPLGVISFD